MNNKEFSKNLEKLIQKIAVKSDIAISLFTLNFLLSTLGTFNLNGSQCWPNSAIPPLPKKEIG